MTSQTKQSQRQRIVSYCKIHGSITNRDAMVTLRINSPTKRISELKEMGYIVDFEWEKGENSRYKRYYIKEPGVSV